MTQHPLQNNYYALFLSIVKGYSPDKSVLLMGAGPTEASADTVAAVIYRERRRERGELQPAAPRRPPEHARLARLYS